LLASNPISALLAAQQRRSQASWSTITFDRDIFTIENVHGHARLTKFAFYFWITGS
jgi:hypothetical protein